MSQPRTVLVAGERAWADACVDALSARGFDATVLDGELPSALIGVAALVVQAEPNLDRAAFARAWVGPARAASCLVFGALDSLEPTARDRLLIAGATDVSPEGDPDDLAARVEASLAGWMRTGPRRKLKTSFKAQRGRQTFDLAVVDIDPGGIGLVDGEGVVSGELLRLALPLPDGPLVAWGRVSEAEGIPGVRFLGLSVQERRRIASAVQGKPRAAVSRDSAPKASAAAVASAPVPPPVPSQTPTPTASAVPVSPTPVRTPSAPVQSLSSVVPVATTGGQAATAPVLSAREETPFALDISVDTDADVTPLAPSGAEAAPVAEVLSDADIAEKDVATSDRHSAATAAGAEANAVDSIADAIGELLSENSQPSVPVLRPVPSDGGAAGSDRNDGESENAEPELPLQRWPTQVPTAEEIAPEFETAVTLGLVSSESNDGLGDRILEFARALTPIERRAWDENPPEEVLVPELLQRQLNLRMRFFLLISEGQSLAVPPEARWEIDEELLRPLKAEANALLDEIQQLADEYLAAGELARMKALHPIRSPLTRALDDLRTITERLLGLAIEPSLGRIPLDSDERSPDEAPEYRPARKAPAQKAQEKRKEAPLSLPRRNQNSRTARRMAVWSLVLAALVAILVVIQPERARRVGTDIAGNVAGVMEVVVVQDKATVQMSPGWIVDPVSVETIRRNLQQSGIRNVLIVGNDGRLLAIGRAQAPLRIVGR